MSQSNRGAAQVSLMWAIALLLVALVSVFVAYSTSGKLVEAEDALVAKNGELEAAKAAELVMRRSRLDISQKAGWQPSSTDPSEVGLMENAIQQLGTAFPSADAASPNIEAMLPTVISDYQAAKARIGDMESQIAQLRADLDARQDANTTSLADKDSTISDLQSELDDTRNSLSEQIVDLERQRDALRDQYRELDDRLTQTEAENKGLRSILEK